MTDSNGSISLNKLLALPFTDEELAVIEKVDGIQGFFTNDEIKALYRLTMQLAHPARILEIGSYRGRSSSVIGYAIAGTTSELYCLDVWGGEGTKKVRQRDRSSLLLQDSEYAVLEDFLHNTAFIGDALRLFRGSSRQFANLLPTGFFDLIFIDASHTYEDTYFDIELGFRCLKPGGIICGHDFHSDGIGVKKAVNEMISSSPTIREIGKAPNSSVWYARCHKPLAEWHHSLACRLIIERRHEEALAKASEALTLAPESPALQSLVSELSQMLKR